MYLFTHILTHMNWRSKFASFWPLILETHLMFVHSNQIQIITMSGVTFNSYFDFTAQCTMMVWCELITCYLETEHHLCWGDHNQHLHYLYTKKLYNFVHMPIVCIHKISLTICMKTKDIIGPKFNPNREGTNKQSGIDSQILFLTLLQTSSCSSSWRSSMNYPYCVQFYLVNLYNEQPLNTSALTN